MPKNQLEKDLATIKDIGDNKFGTNIKKRMEANVKGALIGGGIGVIVGIGLKKNPVYFGIAGLILGRIVLNKKK